MEIVMAARAKPPALGSGRLLHTITTEGFDQRRDIDTLPRHGSGPISHVEGGHESTGDCLCRVRGLFKKELRLGLGDREMVQITFFEGHAASGQQLA